MSQQITIKLKTIGNEKKNIQGSEHSITINKNATLRDILTQDFKGDKWITLTGQSMFETCCGFVLIFQQKQIGSQFLNTKLSNLNVKNGSELFIVIECSDP